MFFSKATSEAMTSDVLVVHPDTPLTRLQEHFERYRFNGLPVVDEGKLVGWVTQFDLLNAFVSEAESPESPYDEVLARPTEAIMSIEPESVLPDETLAAVLKRMIETRHRSFPVATQQKLLGVIAREDIIKGLRESLGGK